MQGHLQLKTRMNAGFVYTNRKIHMKQSYLKKQFICPECGSTEPIPTPLQQQPPRGDGLRHTYTCANCLFEIPVHLAERWGGISFEDAAKEWRVVYRGVRTEETGVTP